MPVLFIITEKETTLNNQSYSLTKTQKRVWFNSKLSEKAIPNIVMVFELNGDLDTWTLRNALENLVDENSVLKSTIYSSAEHLERIINPAVRGNLEIVDLTQSEKQADIFWMLQNIASMRFNLNTGPLFHFHLIKVTDHHFYFTILVHPIIVDRYSLKYLVKEISRHYNKIILNQDTDREELFDFNKIVELEKKFNTSEKCRQGLTHWTNTLKTSQFNLELPRKGYFPSQEYADSPFFEIHLDNHLRQAVKEFAKLHQVDDAIVLLAAYQALLYKYTGNQDVIVNYSSAVTYNEKKVFGCLENRLPLRVVLNDHVSFVDLIKLSKTQWLYDSYYKDIQINDIVKAVRDKYDSHFSGIFSNTSFDYNYLPYEELSFASVKTKLIPKFMKKFVSENLALYHYDNGETISLIADFDEHLDGTAVKNFLNHYKHLLSICLQAPDQAIANHTVLTNDEYQKILIEWNQTHEEYPHEFVHHLFEKEVGKNPDALAVVFQEQQLTYAELNDKANQLAHYIRKKMDLMSEESGDKLIGICLNRSLEMIISMIAVLKAGAAYVPLDPTYPEDRLVYILDDTQIKIILSEEKVLNKSLFLAEHNRQIICIDRDAEKIGEENSENPAVSLTFSNLAYIIYTSGSTGMPKGVMIEHQSIPNMLYNFGKDFQLNTNKRVLQFSSMNFDAAIPEIFAPLIYGSAIFIAPEDIRQSADKLTEFLEKNRITTAIIPPALLRILPRHDLPLLETLMFAGDVCDQETVDYWAKGRRFINGYGPTECTVCATHGFLQPGDLNNRLGRPFSNYYTYVLDKHLTPVPVGMIGELYIGGIGLGRGYVNRSEMTAERFIHNPFGAGKLYKTGDLVRYMPDSHLEYIGRLDFEVKIRGFRIQLADIEHVIQLLPAIKQVTTKIWQKPGMEKVIAAYYALKDGYGVTTRELREHLQKHLPEYMVPGYLIEMEYIPVSVNGKINKALLPDPFPQSTSGKIENHEEQVLKEIWIEIFKLSTDAVNAHSDFFDLGGHSLLATQLASRIKDRMKVEITIKDIFQHSQLKQIAKMIRESRLTEERKFVLEKLPVDSKLSIPSFAQMRFWFYFKTNPHSTAYNILFSAKFSHNVDVLALRKALTKFFSAHSIFKNVFFENEGEVYLKKMERILCEIPLIDCETLDDVQTEINNEKKHVFDLTILPLFRCKLLLSDAHGVTLVFNVHHSIFDGGSLGVMMNQVGEIYNQIIQHKTNQLELGSFEYHDFAYSQFLWKEKGLFDQQLAYWQRKLHLPLPVLELPIDFKRPIIATDRGDCIRFNLPENLVKSARKIAARNKTSLFSLLLAAYSILLQRLTHQNDIIIASPIANRNQQELENVIGMVANVVTYRARFSDDVTFDDLLQTINQDVIGTQENQDIPFDLIVNQVHASRDISRNPIFQTLFVLQSGFKLASSLSNTDVSYQITEEHTQTAKFDLTLSLYDDSSENAISGYFEFNTDLFHHDSVSRYMHYFINILQTVTDNPQRVIANIPYLGSEEYHALVYQANQTEKEMTLTTIHREFENCVRHSPHQIAVVYQDETISYDLLNSKSNQLARHIRQQYQLTMQRELSGDVLVGLCMDRSIDMIISLLAILKAGAAFLPLDPYYPKERLNYILEDSDARIILTKEFLLQECDFLREKSNYLICIDKEKTVIDKFSQTNLNIPVKPTDLAYVIYTSGSTGRPKGVMLEHKGVINLADSCKDAFGISSADRVLQFASINFDAAVLEIFETLLNGATLYVASEKVRIDTDALMDYLAKNNISYAVLPPALLRVLPQENLPALKKLSFGGDICDQDTVDYWMNGRDFYNRYGPTEITVCATYAKLSAGDSANCIGKALNNYKLYVLDKNLSPVPVGVLGELYIGGIGLARGYLNRPELTVERFIVNPFSDNPSERLYKTGDIVRWRTAGELEYIGRSDFQVQIRGFRVELGEIEEILNQHPAIKQAAVTTIGDDITKKLIAYYVLRENDESCSANELRDYLQKELPDYMVPGHFIMIDKMPLSPSGKIDKQALPKMTEDASLTQNYVAPRNDIEIQLVNIWSELFNYQKIGIQDDFFSLGGNSLLTIRMLAKVKNQFDFNMTLTQFFQHPTIAYMAEMIAGKEIYFVSDQIALAEADANLQCVNDTVIYPEKIEFNHILLTGANGFLGTFLLRELLLHTNAVIHCIVRGKNIQEIQSKMQEACVKFEMQDVLKNPRVNLIKGDLTQPQLAMADETWKFLIDQCDAIYHNGSLVNHIYTYSMLKAANVGSTIELMKLATLGKSKIVNYISTLSAATQFSETGAALETGPDNKANLASGYQLSKWVSECILSSAASRGLKINIFRPGNITGDMKKGMTQFENNNLLLLLKSCIELGVAPAWETHLEMFPVDVLSHAIIQLSLRTDMTQHVFNMANHHAIQWRNYFKLVNAAGYDLQLISPQTWFEEYLSHLSESNALYPLRELYLTHSELSIKGPEFQFDNTHSRRLLEDLKIFYPDNYELLVSTYVTYLKDKGFLPIKEEVV